MSTIQLTLDAPQPHPRILGPSDPTDAEIRHRWVISSQPGTPLRYHHQDIPAHEYDTARLAQQAEHDTWYRYGRTDHRRFNGAKDWLTPLTDDALILNYWHHWAASLLPHSAYEQGVRDACAEEAARRSIAIPDADHVTPDQWHRHCPHCRKAFGWGVAA